MMNRASLDTDSTLVLRDALKVMVVDNNKESLGYVGEFLESHALEVTCVDQAGIALRMLMDNKNNYDILFIDSELRDVDVITFLRLTKNMHMIPMVMREEEDDAFLMDVMNNGGYLVVKRPLTRDVISRARQYVIKEQIKNLKQFRMADGPNTLKVEREGPREGTLEYYEARKSPHLYERLSEGAKKISLEWTEELHSKFLRAVRQLEREGRCYPKEILDTMGVPGLTRMQIASHLQKCRRGGWEFHGNRRRRGSSFIGSCNISEVDSESYGCMPHNVKKQEERIPFFDGAFSTKGEQKDMDPLNNHSLSGSSSTNGYGFQKIGQVYPVPVPIPNVVPDTEGSNHENSPENKESNGFFYLLKSDDVNPSFSFTTLDLFGPNSTHEQTSPDDDHVMNNKATPVINEHIYSLLD